MFEDNFSCIKSVVKTVHIALPSVFVSNEIAGVIEILESWKRQYVQQLKGIVVGYKNVSLISNSGFIVIDKPFMHYDVKAAFDLFYPTVGNIVKGTINRISPNHIGCLVHSTINVTIHLSPESSEEVSEFIQLDREILFQVTHFDFQRKIVRVKGKITPECIRLMKDLFPCLITNSPYSSLSTHLSDVEGTTYNSKGAKKKRKHNKNLDSNNSTEYINCIASVSENDAHGANYMNLELDTKHFSNIEMTSFNSKSAKKKSKHDKYLQLHNSAQNATSSISSTESKPIGVHNMNSNFDSIHLSNVEVASLNVKNSKKKKKHEKYFDSNSSMDSLQLHSSAQNATSSISSTESKPIGAHNMNSDFDSIHLSNAAVTSHNVKISKKKKKHEKHFDSNSSMDSLLLNTNAKSTNTLVIKDNIYDEDDLKVNFDSTHPSNTEATSFKTKSTKKKKKREKYLDSNNLSESVLLKNNADSFIPVVRTSVDDNADFPLSSCKDSEDNFLLSDAETVDFSTYIDSQSSKKNKLSAKHNTDLEKNLPSRKKETGRKKEEGSPSLSPEKLIQPEKYFLSHENASLLTVKSLKKKKCKSGNEENCGVTSKISDKNTFDNIDFGNFLLKIKKEPEETTVSEDKSLSKKGNRKRKRELSHCESPTASSPKKKKHKHDKKEMNEKSLRIKKEKSKSKKKDKHKKSDKDSSLNKSHKEKKKPKKSKEKKNLKNKKEGQKVGLKSKHKKAKKSSNNRDETIS